MRQCLDDIRNLTEFIRNYEESQKPQPTNHISSNGKMAKVLMERVEELKTLAINDKMKFYDMFIGFNPLLQAMDSALNAINQIIQTPSIILPLAEVDSRNWDLITLDIFDPTRLEETLQININVLQNAPDYYLKSHRFALACVSYNGMALQYLTHFQDNEEIVQKAMLQNPKASEFASERLKLHPTLVKIFALLENGLDLFQTLQREQCENKAIAYNILRKHPKVYRYLCDHLKNDHDIMECALRGDPTMIRYFCEETIQKGLEILGLKLL
jgi:hypothetical protein